MGNTLCCHEGGEVENLSTHRRTVGRQGSIEIVHNKQRGQEVYRQQQEQQQLQLNNLFQSAAVVGSPTNSSSSSTTKHSNRRVSSVGSSKTFCGPINNAGPSLTLEQRMQRSQTSPDFQWLEGRRYHNVAGASYLLPNDIDEVDRLQLQHFILRYAIQGNYKSPLEKSKVRTILDVGCGPGTWTMEMANEFPDAIVTGIDMSSVFPTTIIPGNSQFIQHNIIQGLPFPDNYFDFVYQRLLIAGLTPADWVAVVVELERVTKPGGWIELVECDGYGGNNGPSTAKIWAWIQTAFAARGVDTLVGRQPGLVNLLKQANVTNIRHDILKLPTGEHGGKIGALLMENEHSLWNAMAPVLLHAGGADKYELERAMEESRTEVEKYKSYHIFYNAYGQKRERNGKEEEKASEVSRSRGNPIAL